MKKIINAVDQVENQMIEGMVKAFPQYVKKLDCGNVVVRAEKKTGKVALISGGGSGHEPAHGGFVGKGMLDAAVAGAVFTSPTPDQIYEGIKAAESGGCDRGNFSVPSGSDGFHSTVYQRKEPSGADYLRMPAVKADPGTDLWLHCIPGTGYADCA